MYIAPNRPWQLPHNMSFDFELLTNEITDDKIIFEYYDGKDFIENEHNGIYKLQQNYNKDTYITQSILKALVD